MIHLSRPLDRTSITSDEICNNRSPMSNCFCSRGVSVMNIPGSLGRRSEISTVKIDLSSSDLPWDACIIESTGDLYSQCPMMDAFYFSKDRWREPSNVLHRSIKLQFIFGSASLSPLYFTSLTCGPDFRKTLIAWRCLIFVRSISFTRNITS